MEMQFTQTQTQCGRRPPPRNEPATEKYPGHMHKNTQIKNMRNGWSGLTQKKQMQKTVTFKDP